MKGSEVVLSTAPKGTFEDCIVYGTSKPGTCMELKTGTARVGGLATYQARSATAGTHGPVAVLDTDYLQGKIYSDAYVSGRVGRVYWPAPGEELNLLLGDVAGTGDTVAIGDKFGINNDGKIKRDSSYDTRPFQALEAISAATADEWVWCKFLGSFA